MHCSLLVFLLRFFRALCWVRIVDDNCCAQETALQERRKHLEGPSRSCEGRVKSYVCRTRRRPSFDNIHATLTMNIQDSPGYAGGAAEIPQANAINDISHPNLTTNIHNSSGYAGGAPQIPQVNAINDKPCPNLTTNIHSSSGYVRGAAQIPQANDFNDKSCPNSTVNTHSSSGYAGGTAQIPQVNDINDKSHPNLTRHITNCQVMLEALPKSHRQMQLMTCLIPI